MTDIIDALEGKAGSARAPRETRAEAERPKVWQPASTLPEPDKQAGYVYRWIRVSAGGKNDAPNVSSKLREGWEPVAIEEQPQFQMLVDPDSRFKNNIEVAGLLLCKAPEELMKQRKEYFARKTSLRWSQWTITSCVRTTLVCHSSGKNGLRRHLAKANS